jgi:predicted amidophosphoribosyltransferase
MEPIPKRRCERCERALPASNECSNALCRLSVERRGWQFIWAIAMRTGALSTAITKYRYQDKYGWGWIFGRILAGYLESMPDVFHGYDLIIPTPTYTGSDGRAWDHTRFIVERAEIESPGWPMAYDVIQKTGPTRRLAGLSRAQRQAVCETELAPMLRVTDPQAVAGKDVLVFDDVFTSGLTLQQVALTLVAAGASSVSGIVLARQPFRP